MKTKKIFKKTLLFFLVGTVAACAKYNNLAKEDPTGNPSYLYGRLFLTDTLSQNVLNVPQSGKTVTVNYQEATDTLNYLYSATTDANGYFKFSTLNAGRSYVVRYMDNSTGKILFGRSGPLKLPDTQDVLQAGLAMTGQSGFVVSVSDGQGFPVTGAAVCLSTSMVPYNSGVCTGSQYSLVSDANGHVSQFGISLGTYYIVANITINGVVYSAKGSISIPDSNVKKTTLQLNLPPAPTNQLTVYVYDINNNPLNGAQVCLFTSPVLAARDTCQGSSYSTLTDPTGKAVISNINPGKYYLLGVLALTNFKLMATDTLTINAGNYNEVFHLK